MDNDPSCISNGLFLFGKSPAVQSCASDSFASKNWRMLSGNDVFYVEEYNMSMGNLIGENTGITNTDRIWFNSSSLSTYRGRYLTKSLQRAYALALHTTDDNYVLCVLDN